MQCIKVVTEIRLSVLMFEGMIKYDIARERELEKQKLSACLHKDPFRLVRARHGEATGFGKIWTTVTVLPVPGSSTYFELHSRGCSFS